MLYYYSNIAALLIRRGFRGILDYHYYKEPTEEQYQSSSLNNYQYYSIGFLTLNSES